jgi:hypothetical protein
VTQQTPQLLIDTDAFCKLAAADLLNETLALLGVGREQCATLPALPYMLARGGLRKKYGEHEADRLRQIASGFSSAPTASSPWLDMLAAETSIDPGEAQLFALAAEHGIRILSGDKRALEALANVPSIHSRLSNRVVTLEAVLMGLANQMTDEKLRQKGIVLGQHDSMARAVFGSVGSPLGDALNSYMRDLESRAKPLDLWRHRE